MNSPPLWVFCLSFQGFFDHFLFSLGFASVFDQISIKIVLLKRNHLQITIKFPSAHIIRHLYYYFKPCWCKFCGILEFSPWVLGFFSEFWVFPWVLHFLEIEFYSKCRISKPGLMQKKIVQKKEEITTRYVPKSFRYLVDKKTFLGLRGNVPSEVFTQVAH